MTSFEFRLYPIGPTVMFAGPIYLADKARTILPLFREFMCGAPDDVSGTAFFWTIPDVPAFPPQLHGKSVLIIGALYAGAADEGSALLQPLRELDEPILDLSSAMPYTVVQQMFDPFYPKGDLLYYWKSLYLDDLSDPVIEEIISRSMDRPSPLSNSIVWPLGGALARVSADKTPLGRRDAPFLLEILANWSDPAASEENIAWARAFFAAMHRFSSGRPNLNFPGLYEEGEQLVRAAFGPNYERLVLLKKRYDPTNLFRLNQNIVPKG